MLILLPGGLNAGSSDFGLGGGYKITPDTMEIGKSSLRHAFWAILLTVILQEPALASTESITPRGM